MKILENKLYLEMADAVACGMDDRYIRKAKSTGTKTIPCIDDPADRRKVLIDYEGLATRYKEMVQKRWPNPYDQLVKEPIRKMVSKDIKAEAFFLQYRYDDNKCLPLETAQKYTNAASWLNMLNQAECNKKEIKKLLNLSLADFWLKVCELIEEDKIGIPATYKRLRERMQEYKTEGYKCLIHAKHGNNCALKIKDEVAQAQLLSLIENPKQFDSVIIAQFYNSWAANNDRPTINPATVNNWKYKNESSLIMGREGNSAFNEKFIRQVKGTRPSSPLYLVEHDDNNLDFLFKDQKGYAFHKYVAIVVTDSFCDLVLGKSYIIGRNPVMEQVHHAYLDAMYYIRSLTGAWYMPFELKADKYALTALQPFYSKIGKFIVPAHGNKHRGYIEPFFGSDHWKRSQQIVSETDNWSGNNMTAKFRGVNQEVLKDGAKNRPLIGEEAELQIENFFHMLRHMPDFKREEMNAPSKEQKWLQAWSQLSMEQKRPITDEQFLLTFGIKHNPQGRTISITNRGVEPQINNSRYSYDLPEAWMYSALIGSQVNIYYDPYDMSRVLVTDGAGIRFVATTAQYQPRALQDQYTNSRTFLNAVLTEKKDQVQKSGSASARRKELTSPALYNAEALMQGGALIKEIKNTAEHRMLEETFNVEHEQFLDSSTDYSEFFNNKINP